MDERGIRVWIRPVKLKSGKNSYHLRWIDRVQHRWRSKRSGTDRKRADRDAAVLESQLNAGTYVDVRDIAWDAFVAEHVDRIEGKRHAEEAERVLNEFGRLMSPKYPRSVTYNTLEGFVKTIRKDGNSAATCNKKSRYLRAALNAAVKRGYLAKNPFDSGLLLPVEEPIPRIITPEEEAKLLKAADELYGSRMRAFIVVALATGGRRGELLSLTWERITLDGAEPHVVFTMTKSHRDRVVPLHATAVSVLRRLQAATLRDRGPFRGLSVNQIVNRWQHVCHVAKVEGLTIHDLRRSFATRLSRVGVPLAAARKLLGHAKLATTMKYYVGASEDDLRDAIQRLEAATG